MDLLSALLQQFVHRLPEYAHCREPAAPQLNCPSVALLGADSEGHVDRCVSCNRLPSPTGNHLNLWCIGFLDLLAGILFELGPRLPYWLYHLLLFVFILLGVFSTPLLLAYIFHRLELRGTLKNLGTKPSPTPSDLLFSNSEGKHYYVRFHRKDGKDLGGYFGENSFAELQRLHLLGKRSMSKKSGDWMRMGGLLNASRGLRALS
jgi:hypothetical protein